jgi:hypothetical protein
VKSKLEIKTPDHTNVDLLLVLLALVQPWVPPKYIECWEFEIFNSANKIVHFKKL